VPTFSEVFRNLSVSSRSGFHVLDENTYIFEGDVLLHLVVDGEPIRRFEGDPIRRFDEPWVRKFRDQSADWFGVHVMYGGLRIHTFAFIRVYGEDGLRYMVPQPTSPDMQIDELQVTIGRIVQGDGGSLDEAMRIAGISAVKLHNRSLMY